MTEPTLEQLARFMCVRTLGPDFTRGDVQRAERFLQSDVIRKSWLDQHREFQAAVNPEAAGDPRVPGEPLNREFSPRTGLGDG